MSLSTLKTTSIDGTAKVPTQKDMEFVLAVMENTRTKPDVDWAGVAAKLGQTKGSVQTRWCTIKKRLGWEFSKLSKGISSGNGLTTRPRGRPALNLRPVPQFFGSSVQKPAPAKRGRPAGSTNFNIKMLQTKRGAVNPLTIEPTPFNPSHYQMIGPPDVDETKDPQADEHGGAYQMTTALMRDVSDNTNNQSLILQDPHLTNLNNHTTQSRPLPDLTQPTQRALFSPPGPIHKPLLLDRYQHTPQYLNKEDYMRQLEYHATLTPAGLFAPESEKNRLDWVAYEQLRRAGYQDEVIRETLSGSGSGDEDETIGGDEDGKEVEGGTVGFKTEVVEGY
ncbi:MAG: hypothetical protein M1817_003698 [Caeruleum heppii]|nr:MAG: hypothetical protein M1817_003698 [Caeruleum heppii]